MTPVLTSHPLLKIVSSSLIDLPTPTYITGGVWTLGMVFRLCLIIPIVSVLFLSMLYCSNVMSALSSVNYGWMIEWFLTNGVLSFSVCVFLLTSRGLYYGSYLSTHTWVIGMLIMLMVMATAFLGYVLPWGQMSFWGATVITNFFSAIPYLGGDLVTWLWDGLAVSNATLTYNVLFRCFFIGVALMLITMGGFFILKHYWRVLLRLSVYLVSQLLFMYLLINVFGVTPKPLLAATMLSPELSLKPELVHASITAILTNWPHSHEQHMAILETSKLVSFSTYETKYLRHLQGMFKERFNWNKQLNDVYGYTQVRSTESMEPVHQIYNYLQCPLPAQFKEDSHLSTNNLLNRINPSDVFFTMKDPALMHQTLTSLS